MAKRERGTPKLLLSMIAGIVTAFTLIYGSNFGWFCVHMWYLYCFFVVYYFSICKGNKVACCYTATGIVSTTAFLLGVKFVGSVLGLIIGLTVAGFAFLISDTISRTDWRYLSLGDFDLSSFPIERSIQFMFDQHVPVSEASASSPPEPETAKKVSEVELQSPKKKNKTPLSRKEKKAEAKKQKKRF